MKKELTTKDPYRVSTWDPLREIRRMQYEMSRLIGSLMGEEMPAGMTTFGEWTPAVESYRKGDDLVFKCQLPGVDPNDVEVTYDEESGQMLIKGERKEEKEGREKDYLYRELEYGTFERTFALPHGVKSGQLKAKFDKGMLEITVPVPQPAKGRKIEIESKPAGEKAEKRAA